MERDHNRTCGTSPASYNQIILVPEGTGRHFMLAKRHHSRARWFKGPVVKRLSAVKSINENAEMASNLTRNFFYKNTLVFFGVDKLFISILAFVWLLNFLFKYLNCNVVAQQL